MYGQRTEARISIFTKMYNLHLFIRKEGFNLIAEMVKQILQVHHKSTHIHIGRAARDFAIVEYIRQEIVHLYIYIFHTFLAPPSAAVSYI